MKLLSTIHMFDLRAFQWCLKRQYREQMVTVARWISRSADGYLYAVVGAIALLEKHWLFAKVLAVGFLIERVLYFILKNTLKRRRPQQTIPSFISVIQPSDQFSFPSGHTSAAFLMMAICSVFFPTLSIMLVIWAVSVGASRVLLGVHFPTDTMAGAILGYSVGILSLSFFSL